MEPEFDSNRYLLAITAISLTSEEKPGYEALARPCFEEAIMFIEQYGNKTFINCHDCERECINPQDGFAEVVKKWHRYGTRIKEAPKLCSLL